MKSCSPQESQKSCRVTCVREMVVALNSVLRGGTMWEAPIAEIWLLTP
ncbi:hypothetical protein PRUB_a0890 [Pseudoalteromonas rubra]|uniref:Uncharacterized protein n=1 Tax=Pseudoalteromonas rubra TaxID=43658 RepID=A0A8T0C6J2_9GAMM|nr:hypothetical protein PRUB_a0890 [Pseudoalteromonas rubra]